MPDLRLSMVSYINAKPFQLGLEQSGLINEIELLLEVPSESARKLQEREVDIALVPAASLREIPNAEIITNFCISANGEVASVGLFAELPVEELTHIYLDYQSRTSVQLLKILLHEYWQKDVTFIKAYPGYENEIKGTTGGLIIGDRAIQQKGDFQFSYDLAAYWKAHTDLPFVFAVWVAHQSIDTAFEKRLEEAFKLGMTQKERVIDFYRKEYEQYLDVEHYFEENIEYQLNPDKLRALDLFLLKINQLESRSIA